jgi:TRAP-type transport system periplasmic protein
MLETRRSAGCPAVAGAVALDPCEFSAMAGPPALRRQCALNPQPPSPESAMRTFALALIASASLAAAFPAAGQVVLTASSWLGPAHTLSETQKEWCGLLEQKTAGKAKCNILPRAVSAPPGTLDAVRNGLADISFTVHGYTPGRFVTTQIAEFPFLGDNSEPVSVAFQRHYARNPAMQAEHQGVKVITVFTHGPGIVFNTKRPVSKVEDLSGLKWRVGGGMVNEISKALGMNVTLKPAPESYELLSTGVMDGTLFPAESVESFKIDKVVKYGTQFPGGLYNTSFVFMMNQAKYDSLPPDVKKVVDELSGEMAARLFGKGWDKVDRRGMAFMQAAGVQMIKADKSFVAAVTDKTAGLVNNWAKAAEAKGMKEPIKALGAFRADIAKLQ